jgi:sodium-dependent dicarboxylate transporter 2/3/5
VGKRITVFILSLTGNSTKRIILGFLCIGALLSMWLTDMAVAAILMPLGRAILREEGVKPRESNFGKALMIACAWGPIIGGIATPAGCAPNPITIGFLKEMAGVDITFPLWMLYGVPASLLLIIPGWLILLVFFPPEIPTLTKNRDELRREHREHPALSRDEVVTVVIFLLTIVLWIASPALEGLIGIPVPITMAVLLTSSLLFLPGLTSVSWREVEEDISWSGIILVVAGISVGMMLYKTGAARWLSVVLLSGLGGLSPYLRILVIILIVSLLKITFSSNSVTATIVIPLIIALAKNLGLDVVDTAIPAALTSSLAFILVTSTPTNVIPYSAGYFSIADLAKAGTIMTLVSSPIVALVIHVVGSLP